MKKINFKETIIISVGGSLLVPDNIDVFFVKKLKDIVKSLVDNDYQVALVIGGGKTARRYQSSASKFSIINNTDLDWIGIKAIRLNAEFIFRVFKDLNPYNIIIENWEDAKSIKESVIIVGAYEPGCSSDTDAVELAIVIGANRIINFSNISHVFEEDPQKNPNAKKIEKLSWNDYRKIIPNNWKPGLSTPFDPIASKIAQENNIRVVILGSSLTNLNNYLNDKNFNGTVIL